jgi:nitrogen fixation protein
VTDHEVFQFLTYRWDITKAWKIADGLPVRRFDARPWFGWLGLIQIDEDHLASADLERPILVVKVRELGGAALIVDGWHRLARAQREGVAELPVVVLDEDQEYQVRIWGGDKGLPFLH